MPIHIARHKITHIWSGADAAKSWRRYFRLFAFALKCTHRPVQTITHLYNYPPIYLNCNFVYTLHFWGITHWISIVSRVYTRLHSACTVTYTHTLMLNTNITCQQEASATAEPQNGYARAAELLDGQKFLSGTTEKSVPGYRYAPLSATAYATPENNRLIMH